MADSWNHNTHYHSVLLRLLPRHGEAALEIGSGDGRFAALLGSRYDDVLALDPDPAQVVETRNRCRDLPNVTVREAAFPDDTLPSEHFDVVTALASFHHLPFRDGAAEVMRVLKPGGRLVVLGVWTDNATPIDLVMNATSVIVNRFLRWRRGPDVMGAPATLERTSWSNARREAAALLPGARLRRRLLWRYTMVWDKPTTNRR